MRILILALLACLAVPACQCSDKPDIGPVEGDGSATASILTSVPDGV